MKRILAFLAVFLFTNPESGYSIKGGKRRSLNASPSSRQRRKGFKLLGRKHGGLKDVKEEVEEDLESVAFEDLVPTNSGKEAVNQVGKFKSKKVSSTLKKIRKNIQLRRLFQNKFALKVFLVFNLFGRAYGNFGELVVDVLP